MPLSSTTANKVIRDELPALLEAQLLSLYGDGSAFGGATIDIRRGSTALPPQDVRIGMGRTSGRRDAGGGEEKRQPTAVVGSTTLDILANDRFTVDGVLYRVIFVRPRGNHALKVAEVEAVE